MRPAGEDSEKTAKVKIAIFDATEQIMQEEGYAAVSSRKVARRAGLKSQLVHYYFRTMDDLLAAAWQRYDERFFEDQERALASDRPLTALWKLSTDSADTTLRHEFIALANHRKTFRAMLARSAKRIRNMQVAAINRYFEEHGIRPDDFSSVVLVLLFAFVSRSLITEVNLGVSDDHAEIIRFIERNIQLIESSSRKKGPRRNGASAKNTRTPLGQRRRQPSKK